MRYFVFASLLAAGVFASSCHRDYECCQGCDVIYEDDEAQWGVENNDWCVIPQSCNGEGAIDGYPFCKSCNVYYSDESGDWGVENNDWCLIPNRCGSSGVSDSPIDGPLVVPVISLISSSGTTDFATKPVEKHIAQQAYMGRNMPPEPYYEECTITIEDTDGTKPINGVNGKVKVRGNWTSNYVKKSLRINFGEAQSVLGLNGGKKFKSWVLLAEYKDGSMLRNKSAFALSRDILGVDSLFASDSKLVELVINGEYFGVYLLAEVQQINDGRVSITKADDDYTGTDIGYLLEHDTGYSMYEEKMESLVVDFNDNAPLKPFDGNGGSGKTIQPKGGSFGGFPGGGSFPGGGNFPGWGNNNNNNSDNSNNNNNNQQRPGAGNFPGWGNNNNNQQQTQQPTNPTQNNNNNQNWGGNNWGNFNIGGNLKKRQFGFGASSNENMTIKSGANSQEQHDFIAKYINNVYKIMYEAAYNQKALKFNNDYSDIVEASNMTPRQAIEAAIDVNSLADMYIISEMTCDADLYYSSFYMDVDFGSDGSKKLRFEAPWDFDSGLGNKDRCADGKGHFAANIIPDNGGFGSVINPWLAVIMYEEWYQDIIRNKWTKAYDNGVFGRVVDMIHSDSKNFEEAFTRNYAKWNNIIDNKSFASELSAGARQCKTQGEAANYLAKWFESRVAFVNSFWHK